MMRRSLLFGCMILVLLVPTVTIFAQYGESCPEGPVAKDAPVLKIGAAVSLTGKYSREGSDVKDGYVFWRDWVNEARGGVNVGGECYRVEIVFYDDQSTPSQTASYTERMIRDQGVSFILGPYSTELTMVASEVTERENVIMMAADGPSEELYERGFSNLFGVMTPARLYTRSGIEQAAALGAQTAVVAYQDIPFSAAVAEGAQYWLEDSGIEVLAFEGYPPETTDVTEMFTRFRDLKPDLFIGAGHFNDTVMFVNTAKEVGFSPAAFLFTVGPSSPVFVEQLEDKAEFVWGTSQWESAMVMWQDQYFGTAADYAARYEEKFGLPPSYHAAGASAAALVLQIAIENAGSIDTGAVRTSLREIDILTFYGPIRFDGAGQNMAKPMVTTQIQNGAIVIIAPENIAAAETIWPAPAWDARSD